ncbi:glycosyl transferase [Pseudomonas mosselii]|nr:glycosyl transferase [Pseudomonas mosselii]
MTPRCLVLLAAYNGRAFIEEQVRSILDQRDVSVSLLISVDRSNDGTEAWVDELARVEPRVQALPHGLRFGGAAPNFFRLIEAVSVNDYDFFALADQDDIWLEGKLARGCEVLQQKAVQGFSSDVLAFWPDGSERLVRKSQPQVAHDHLFEAAGPGCTYILDHTLMTALQASVQGHGEELRSITLHDWYIYAFARANGFSWHIDDQALMRYRQHDSNQVGVNRGLDAYKARLGKVLDGWWLGQSTLIARLIGLVDDPFVKQWQSLNRAALLNLACKGRQCRRRLRDQLSFSIFCLALAIVGGGR